MKHITFCFSKELVDICQKSFKDEKWQEIIHAFLQPPLNQHVFLGSFKLGKMVLIVDCPLWGSQLRMKIPELRDFLRSQHQCHQLGFIEMKIEPSFYKKN